MGAYALGYQSAPVSHMPVLETTDRSGVALPVALSGAAARLPGRASARRATSAPAPSGTALLEEKPSAGDAKRKVEAALSTMQAVGHAPARTIPCATAGSVAGRALTPDQEGLRHLLSERCIDGDD